MQIFLTVLVLAGCRDAADKPRANDTAAPLAGTATTPPTVPTADSTTAGPTSQDAPTDTATTTPTDTTTDTGTLPPLCTETPGRVRCDYETAVIEVEGVSRTVHWQVPRGTPPAGGWPVAFGFHGSYLTPTLNWDASSGLFGLWHQARTTRLLLEAGYAVLTPAAWPTAAFYWDTNIPPYATDWTSSPDHALMLALFDGVDAGRFGPLDGSRVHAFGYSSGGYMASRMTLAYPARVRSIALVSASYATCAGLLCVIPPLPADHAPALLLHGGLDPIVPSWTSLVYEQALIDDGIPNARILRPMEGHVWFDGSSDAVLAWFEDHP